jgi:hypothetical protein
MDARPNDHDHPALSHDLPDHVGNVDQFPLAALWGTPKNGRSFFPLAETLEVLR